MNLSDASDVRLGDELVHRIYLGTDLVYRGLIPIIEDDFSDPAATSANWDISQPGYTSIHDGVIEFDTRRDYLAGSVIRDRHSLADCIVAVQIEAVPAKATYTDTWLSLDCAELTGSRDAITWDVERGSVSAYITTAGSFGSPLVSTPFVPNMWLRVRHDGSAIHWETSTDGATWTHRASVVPTFDITDTAVSIGVGGDPSMGNPRFSHFRWERLG